MGSLIPPFLTIFGFSISPNLEISQHPNVMLWINEEGKMVGLESSVLLWHFWVVLFGEGELMEFHLSK